jgi:hypothetical protein
VPEEWWQWMLWVRHVTSSAFGICVRAGRRAPGINTTAPRYSLREKLLVFAILAFSSHYESQDCLPEFSSGGHVFNKRM